jgi:hypothetical protein
MIVLPIRLCMSIWEVCRSDDWRADHHENTSRRFYIVNVPKSRGGIKITKGFTESG